MTELDSMLLDAKRLEERFIVQEEVRLNTRIQELERESRGLLEHVARLEDELARSRTETANVRAEYDMGRASLLAEHEAELGRSRLEREEEIRTREEIKDAFKAILEKNRAQSDALRA